MTPAVPQVPPAQARDWLFYAYLGLLLWLPLPLASARPWAWAILEVWAFALMALWFRRNREGAAITPALAKARPALLLLGLWLVYGIVQITPLPSGLVEFVSPNVLDLHASLSGLGPQGVPSDRGWLTFSIDPYASAVAWLKSLAYGVIFLLTILLVDGRERLRILAYVLVYSALFQAVYGSLMVLSGLEYGFLTPKSEIRATIGAATGTFVNRNHLAEYLVMCLAVGIGLLIADLGGDSGPKTARERLRGFIRLIFSPKARLRLYLAVMVIGLVLTRSRMGNTAFFVSLLVAGVVALALARNVTRSTVILLASLVIIDLFILGAWFGVEQVAERVQQTTLGQEDRDEVTKYGLNLWRDYPLTGVGAGGFYAGFPRYRGEGVSAIYHHAHNDYIQFLAEYGAIGMAIIGSVVLLSLAAALTVLRKRRDPLMRGMAFAAAMGITAMLLHSTVEFNLQIPATAATFMVILALGWIALGLESGNSEREKR